MWWTASEDVNFLINYQVDGEYVIPTSAAATVRDATGVAITGLEDVALSVDTTSATLTIPGANNTVAADLYFENRYISLRFVYEGQTYTQTMHYQVAEFLPITTSPDDVRRELGLDPSEVPDRDVNILSAYVSLREEVGQPLEDALLTGTIKSLAANRAIAVKAALELVNGLEFRAAVKMKAEDSAVERMSDFNVDSIRIRLGQRLASLVNTVLGETTEGSSILLLSTPTDVITGV